MEAVTEVHCRRYGDSHSAPATPPAAARSSCGSSSGTAVKTGENVETFIIVDLGGERQRSMHKASKMHVGESLSAEGDGGCLASWLRPTTVLFRMAPKRAAEPCLPSRLPLRVRLFSQRPGTVQQHRDASNTETSGILSSVNESTEKLVAGGGVLMYSLPDSRYAVVILHRR